MAKFINVSPLGALDIPAIGRVVQRGEEFEVRDELAPTFAGQTANFIPADHTVPELRALATDIGLDVPSDAKRAEIIAALTGAANTTDADGVEEGESGDDAA
ncbi:hypothetical protein [Microbacterium sp. UBA837]|uniref:hypothetical protein n=1 Tax=Microbacterium sp. UBA837 TaxID=1946956 RepID=UPI0025F6B432|nr:hypothetical protein [Microbacterium sp. UBA837]|tara:strand:- start:778 stop:1083 length:306 start_codon:yes stop_codon:yes gene_type:complete